MPFCFQRPSPPLLALGLWLVMVLAGLSAQAAPATPRDFIVAVVDSVPITNHEVTLRATRLKQDLARDGKPVPANLLHLALERLITEKALLEHAREFGVEVDATAVEQAEQRLADQQQLSLEAFHRTLRAQGSSPERLRRELRDQITLQRLAERNVPSRIRVSDAEIDAEIQARIKASPDLNPDINLAHILIAVPERASAEQVAALEQRAQDVLDRLRKGADFAVMAKEVSDSSERERGGLMGLRPLDRYPTLFGQAVRDLSVGQFAPLLRSGAGFHILKLVDRQSQNAVTVTETRVRHILLRQGGQLSLVAARARMTEYKRLIESGKADFATLAREHSQDASGAEGGELGWVGAGIFVPEFEDAMNRLQPGQVSDPVVSRFGVHLIEVLARRQSPLKDRDLRELVRNNLREKKYPETYDAWAQEVRGRAYVEYRDPPQ